LASRAALHALQGEPLDSVFDVLGVFGAVAVADPGAQATADADVGKDDVAGAAR